MLEASIKAAAWFFCGAFSTLLTQAWLAQRATSAAISGKGYPMIAKILALAVIAAAVVAYALCTWADYAVSGSANKATGKR